MQSYSACSRFSSSWILYGSVNLGTTQNIFPWCFKFLLDFLLHEGETQSALLQTCFLANFLRFLWVLISKWSRCAAGQLPSSSFELQPQNRIVLNRSCHQQLRNYFCLENSTFGSLRNQPFSPGFPGQWSIIPASSCTSASVGFDCQPSSFQHHNKDVWSPSAVRQWVPVSQDLPKSGLHCEEEKPP